MRRKIPRASRMQFQPLCKSLGIQRPFGEFREQTKFDGAQQGLRSPKPEPELHDPIRIHLTGGHNVFLLMKRKKRSEATSFVTPCQHITFPDHGAIEEVVHPLPGIHLVTTHRYC